MLVWCADSWDTLDSVSDENNRNEYSFSLFTLPIDAFANVSAAFGPGTGPIHYDNVACIGTEDAVTTCVFDDHTADCSHAEDAGVTCAINCKTFFAPCLTY